MAVSSYGVSHLAKVSQALHLAAQKVLRTERSENQKNKQSHVIDIIYIVIQVLNISNTVILKISTRPIVNYCLCPSRNKSSGLRPHASP